MKTMKNIFDQAVSKTITSAIGVLFTHPHIKNLGRGKEIKTPSDFKPAIRFAVCSDIHLNGETNQVAAVRFRQLFDDMYKLSESDEVYNKFDAVVIAGDFTGGGAEKEYLIFNDIVEKCRKNETQLLTVLGNHEFINYRDTDASVGYDVYKKYINEQVDTHTVINGYHFIGVSYDDDGKKFAGKLEWLREQLKQAVKDTPDKPVFVFQHPHPFATVYGSINWGTYEVRKVLADFPQVVDFSGHSHYAPCDPRSVWQGSFTAVGCGSLSAFMGNLNYIDGDKDAPGESGGYWIVEADADGNVRMRLFDCVVHTFFDKSEYYFTDLTSSSKRSYTWHKNKSLDTKPEFPVDPAVKAEECADGSVNLYFPEAHGYYPAENYKIKLFADNKKTAVCNTFISDYVRATGDTVKINLGKLPKGNYKINIKAYSPYAKYGDKLEAVICLK